MENATNLNLRLEEHMRFVCAECGKENNSQLEWRKHLNVQHSYATKTVKDYDFKEINDKYHECQICMKWIAGAHQTIALLQYHRFQHLPFPRTYRCKHCPAAFTRKKALCEHLCKIHNALIVKLDNERKKKELKRCFEEQNPKHNNEFYMKCLCPLCGKNFDRFNYWLQHIDAAHSATSVDLHMFRIQSTKNYYCAQCNQTLYNNLTKAELQRHNFTHQPYPLYFKCLFCLTKKSFKTELFLHFVKSHKEIFEKYKKYIKRPNEWGGLPDKDITKELDVLFQENGDSQTDILQKAIQESLIDQDEEEVEKELKFNHEVALDQSLRELDDIFYTKTESTVKVNESKILPEDEFDDEELEDLCNEIFEEISDKCFSNLQEGLTKANRKRLKLDLSAPETGLKLNDSQQREMQKYINYLCPECGFRFESQSVWRTHVFEQHDLANAVETKFRPVNSEKTEYICLVCYQVQHTDKHSELRRHHFQHMPYQAYLKCAICTKTKSSKPKMLQHLQDSHLKEIQTANAAATTTRTMVKNLRCLDCDKLYAQQARYEAHCRDCPQRLQPLCIGQYDIEKNMKLVEHLKNASRRIGNLLEEEGIDASSINLPFK